jgi:probable F420-dependent oxidoreductase
MLTAGTRIGRTNNSGGKHMKFGVNLYKFIHYGNDIAGTREFVLTAEQLGYNHVRLLDHVVGVVAEKHPGNWKYHSKTTLREIFTLLGYFSAITERIRLVAAIVVLPMRPTALVAKQAAEIDILSGGRMTLGVGSGYSDVEFEALGASFKDRGARMEEQIDVMRRLWTEDCINVQTRWHTLRDVALSPRPVQRPIPIWFGLGSEGRPVPPDPVLERIGRLGDGWLPLFQPGEEGRVAIEKVHAAARAAGRNPADVVMELNLIIADKNRAQLIDELKRMRDFGATQVNVHFPATSAREEIEGAKRFRDVMDAF